jgi:RNA polymerase sigma-70 factor, ECF subfamily
METNNLDTVYQSYVKDIYRYLRSLCGDHHTAEDLVQETFYRAYLYLEDCDHGDQLVPL